MPDKFYPEMTFDDPVIYKGKLKIYPITIREYLLFSSIVDVLLIDKDSIPDPSIISMPYMRFLLSSNDNQQNAVKLIMLLALCCKIDFASVKVYKDEKDRFVIRVIIPDEKKDDDSKKQVDGDFFDIKESDFEEIKAIILEQNMVDIPDYSIQKEIRDKIDEGKRLGGKGREMAGLEDQIVALSVATGISLESIYSLTYRKFIKYIVRTEMLMNYRMMTEASMSGFVKFDKDPRTGESPIRHWLSKERERLSTDGMVDLQKIKDKINFDDKKMKTK